MFNGFYLTYKGQEYIAKALTGKTLSITRGQFGNGSIGSGIPNERTSLVSPRGDLIISKKEVSGNRLTITTQFSNKVDGGFLPAFYLTEAGIYGKVLNADGTTDSAEVLIAYASCNQSEADYIQQVLTEFIINWPMVISSEVNVEVVIDESLAYVSLEEYSRISRTGTLEVLRGTNGVTSNLSEENGMVELSIYGKSVQDGTPAPDVPVEIVSVENPEVKVCGKNLINIVRGGTTVTVTETVENGMVSFSGTATGSGGRTAWGRSDVITLTPGRYTLSMVVPSGTAGAPILTIAGTTTVAGSLGSFTIKETTDVYLGFNYENGVTYNAQNVKVQLERGDVATEYEPYNEPQTLSIPHTLRGIPVSSGGNYTDADGQQWLCDEVDLERGVLVKRVGSKVLNGKSYTKEVWYEESNLEKTVMFRTGISDAVNVGNVVGMDFVCSNFSPANIYNTDASGAQHTMTQFYFRLPKTLLADGEAVLMDSFRNYLARSPITINYVLATPVEIPLFGGRLTWNGEINDREFISVDGVGTYLVHMSDVVPTIEELQQGASSYSSYDDGIREFASEDIKEHGNCIYPDRIPFVVAKEDNSTLELGGVTLPKKGIYFAYSTHSSILGHTEWLNIHNYTGIPLVEAKLPDDILKTHYPVTNIFMTDGVDAEFEARIKTRSYANSKYTSAILEYLKHKG